MSFLAPFALLLAAAAAVPLVLHLLRRRPGMRLDFPAIRYLQRAEREHARALTVRNLLLMLLRMLAVLTLAMAAARPVGRFWEGGHAPTALAIVLDNSLSTSAVVDGAPVLARLRAAARRAVARATNGDRVWLVTADGAVMGGSPASVRRALDAVQALAGAGDLRGAVARAVQLVKGAGIPATQVVVLTDAQATSWRDTVSLDDVQASVFAPTLTPPTDRAVTRVIVDPRRWTPRGTVRATIVVRPAAGVRTSGAKDPGDLKSLGSMATGGDSVAFRVLLQGQIVARGRATAGAELVVGLAPADTGWLTGSVALEPDELRGDDARWFAAYAGSAPPVTVDATTGPFVAAAMATLVQAGQITRGPGITIASATAARVPALLFAPGDATQLGAANRALATAGIPWRFGTAHTGAAPLRGEGLVDVTATHWYALAFDQASRPTAIDTLARIGGEPWAVVGPGYVLIASPPTPEATDLPVRASWVPWLGRAITDRLAGGAGTVIETAPGVRVPRPDWATALEMPDGTQQPLRDDYVEAPAVPGVYWWRRGAARAGALVVNFEEQETDLTRLAPAELRARFIRGRVLVTDDADRWTDTLFATNGRRALDGALVLMALLLLVAEAFATRRLARAHPVAS